MISSRYTNRKVFGNNPWEIEIADGSTFEEMVASPEMYIPHHKLEKDFTMKELQEMGRYKKVPAEELVWIKRSVHNGNKIIHKDFFKYVTSEAYKEKMKNKMKGNTNGSGNKGRKLTNEQKLKLSESAKKRTRQTRFVSEFGKKYFEHYGYGWKENPSQYCKEKYYHKIHYKFSWED